MKTQIISCIFILIAIAASAQDGGRSYCAAGGGGSYEYISNVTVGAINHSSAYSTYSDFTTFSTNVPSEGATTITVTLGNPYPSDIVGAWIDWNQDGVFTEAMITFSGNPYTQFTGSIVVPPDAIAGPTRLRIRMMDGSPLLPCGSTVYGEVEDYTVNCPTGVPPADISIQPLAISTVIFEHNGTSQAILNIYNEGGLDLTWNASIDCGEIQNHCLDFNGVNQYVHVDQSLPAFSQFTVEFWRYSEGSSTTSWPRMITMVQDPYHSGDCIVIEHTGPDQNTLEITVNDDNNNIYKGYINISDYHNQWVHIALVYDGFVARTYINGQVIHSSPNFAGTFEIQSTQIGGCVMPFIGLYRYFNGRMDEIRIWNIARTMPQIQDCMDSTFCEPQPGMMAYWKLDENTGSIVNDETGNMTPGIIENGAVWYNPGAPIINDCIPPVLTPVIEFTPVSGTIPPGSSAQVNLTFHSGDLPIGVYDDCIFIINSNDKDESRITVPLAVSVTNQLAVIPISNWALVLGAVLMAGMVVVWWRRS